MNENHNMGKWELGCLVFNSLIYKIFTRYPERFSDISASAGWLTSAFAGALFLIFLAVVLKLYSPLSNVGLCNFLISHNRNILSKLVSYLAIVYFSFSIFYATICVCSALKIVSYTTSPLWFIAFFILVAAATPLLCGHKAVLRIHSLSVLGIGISAISIAFFSFKYADIYNIYPLLGSGVVNVFFRGLETLFLYSDILIIFFLPCSDNKSSFSKTVFISALLAVVVNIAIILAISLNSPYELAQRISLPIYPLTKTSSFGKVPLRLDTMYLVALITSAVLYISLAADVVLKQIKNLSAKPKKIIASSLCILLCLSLCGCYDHSEIEENAYVIALGIDKGESERFIYTFQISNPLESGSTAGDMKNSVEDASKDNKNKTVDNITVEATDYRIAIDKLRSILGKTPRLSHMKLIVFSFDVAKEGLLEHSELLLHEREVRPGSDLCLVPSAFDYLTSVKPTLEESTVRYYELFFQDRSIPYAPLTELRDFVGKSLDPSYDAVIPIIDNGAISGMGIFSDGFLKSALGPDEAIIYKMLCGDLKEVSVRSKDTSFLVSNRRKPKISADFSGDFPIIDIKVYIKSHDNTIFPPHLVSTLTQQTYDFLHKTYLLGCDVLGIGRYLKQNFNTCSEWESINPDSFLQKCNFRVNILP